MKVTHGIGDLAADMAAIARRAPGDLRGAVRTGSRLGNQLAKENAIRTAGKHGRRYPAAFSAEMRPTFALFGSLIYSAEYGPTIDKAQGAMSFEAGSRNQKPHRDLAKSADIIGPALSRETLDLVDRWFW